MQNEKEQSWHHYRDVMSSTARLLQHDKQEEALRLLDDAIARAIRENENRWVLTLSHHAAVISRLLGNWSQVKHYYEMSLAFNVENPRVFAGIDGDNARHCP